MFFFHLHNIIFASYFHSSVTLKTITTIATTTTIIIIIIIIIIAGPREAHNPNLDGDQRIAENGN